MITYGQLSADIRRAAVGLSRRGFGKGDVAAIWSPNVPEFAIAFHAAAALGGVVTTINPLATLDELTRQLEDSGARCLFTVPPLVPCALEAARSSSVEEVLVFGESDEATPFASLLEHDGPMPQVRVDAQQDVVALPYSSGTTGLPKGVMLTHRNLVANMCQMDGIEPIGPGDVLIGVLPFFHIYGLVVVLNRALANGATVVTMPRFELEAFLNLLQRHRVTRAHVVPPIVLALAKHPMVERYDLSNLRVIDCGAAPLSGELAEACATRLGCEVKQGFGMTELSPVSHLVPDGASRPGSVGPPVPNTECRVMDLVTGQSVGPLQRGELWIRGPGVMKGYLHQPEASADTVDADGWVHSGDIGYADEDGYFFVVDRVKELIKYKGYQVAPAVLEAVLATHPAIADAGVIGVEDEEAGEIPKAFVALKSDASPEEILAYAAQRVAPYERIRLLQVIDQIPRSASGKILRRVLIERERERSRAGMQTAR
jgi:acyl-CoA synthetase (AMP-forming)/AMP-acid ligase II